MKLVLLQNHGIDSSLSKLPLQQATWLSVKAANGPNIPNVGLLEGEVEVFGKICRASLLVVKDSADPSIHAQKL